MSARASGRFSVAEEVTSAGATFASHFANVLDQLNLPF